MEIELLVFSLNSILYMNIDWWLTCWKEKLVFFRKKCLHCFHLHCLILLFLFTDWKLPSQFIKMGTIKTHRLERFDGDSILKFQSRSQVNQFLFTHPWLRTNFLNWNELEWKINWSLVLRHKVLCIYFFKYNK